MSRKDDRDLQSKMENVIVNKKSDWDVALFSKFDHTLRRRTRRSMCYMGGHCEDEKGRE